MLEERTKRALEDAIMTKAIDTWNCQKSASPKDVIRRQPLPLTSWRKNNSQQSKKKKKLN